MSTSPSDDPPPISRNLVIIAITLAIAALFISMVRSFLIALFLAAIFSAIAYPLFRWIATKLGGRRKVGAALTLLVLTSAILLPGIVLLILVAEQAREVGAHAVPWIEHQLQNPEGPTLEIPDWFPFREQLQAWLPTIATKLGELTSTVGEFAVKAVSALTSGAAHFLLNLFVMLYAMFYFLDEGPALLDGLKRYALSFGGVQDRVFDRAVVVSRATVKGTLVIGIVQGILGGLGFWAFGIEGAAFWGAVMAIASMLPIVGTSLVWIPGVIYLLAGGDSTSAFGLLLWSALIVSNIDNVLRPILVGGDTEMPDLLVLISTFGGLGMFGGSGLIIGPVLAAITMTLLEIAYESLHGPLKVVPENERQPANAAPRSTPEKIEPASISATSGFLDVGLTQQQKRELERIKEDMAEIKKDPGL